jgi:hypothetical protein
MTVLAEPAPVDQVGLSREDVADIRRLADDDVFYFGTVICGHKDLVFVDHAPLMYAAAGCSDKLLGVLLDETLDSYVIREVHREVMKHGLDLRGPEAVGRLSELLRIVDLRCFRRWAKSSSLTHAVRLWKMVKDPNLSSCIITNTDEKSTDFCKQIRSTILSDIFGVVYPDRVPVDSKAMLTERRLTLQGRTVPDKEPSLMAFGARSSPVGYHFDEFDFDDLVGRENRTAAELAFVREFLANIFGLYNPGIRYPIRRVHVGTRWDEEDDAFIVRRFDQTFAVDIPIWHREAYTDNIREPGVPTTEWYPLEAILTLQEEVLTDPEEGPISWRCNFELNPAIGGGRLFPAELVDNASWTPLKGPATNGKEWPQRPDYDKTGKRRVFEGTAPLRFKDFAANPDLLYKITCCDQSFTMDGDEWSVVTVGMDQYNHRYVLETSTGHGPEAMLDKILMHHLSWKSRRIGMEKIAAQHVVELVLKLGDKYRVLRPLVEPVPHANKPKEWRIHNYVAEILRMHRLWLNPHDEATRVEMKRYKPGPNAKDNILDALAMCEVLIQKSLQPREGEVDYKKRFAQRNQAIQGRRDKSTGIPLW